MSLHYDYKKFAILYVDDELQSLKYFNGIFESKFRVFTASSAQEGLIIFEKHKDEIGVIITDQRMPEENGVQFLEKIRAKRPKTIRILATAYSDFDAAIAAVNTGAIYKYVSKPWDVNDLEVTLMRALEFFIVQNERDHLLKEKISALHRIMMTDRLISLGLLASGLSHHLRNSLVAIKVFLDLAPEKLEEAVRIEDIQDTGYWVEFYRSAQQQMKATTQLLDNLGAITLTPEARFESTEKLSSIIKEAYKTKKQEISWIGKDIEVTAPTDEPRLKVNLKLMSRLFDLLLTSISSEIEASEKIEFHILKGEKAGSLKLTVSAKGLSFPDNSLKHLFDPFLINDLQGKDAGLYLLTCFFIVYHHGGEMSAKRLANGEALYEILLHVNPEVMSNASNEEAFLNKVFSTEATWERLLTS